MPDHDVAAALGELERKLRDLEDELQGAPRDMRHRAGAADAPAEAPPAAAPVVPPGPPSGVSAPAPMAFAAAPPPFTPAAPLPPAPPVAFVAAPAPAFEPAPAAPAPAPAVDPLEELGRFRDELERAGRAFLAAYDRALTALQSATALAITAPEAPVAPAPPVAPPPAAPLPPPRASLEEIVLHGTITVDAGPFTDIATLSAFEQAMRSTAGVREVQVRGFEGSCVFLDVVLDRPVALGAALRRAAPVPFTLTQPGPSRLSIAVEPVL